MPALHGARGAIKFQFMKKVFLFSSVLCLFLALSVSSLSFENKVVAQSNHWKMPTPRWCPVELMFASDCTASGNGCQVVKCAKPEM